MQPLQGIPLVVRLTRGRHAIDESFSERLSALEASSIVITSADDTGAAPSAAAGAGASADAPVLEVKQAGQTALLRITGVTPPLTLRGLTLRGQISVNGSVSSGHLIDDCIFDGVGMARRRLQAASSAASVLGGGVLLVSGRLVVRRSTFRNLVAEHGGAFAMDGQLAIATIEQSLLVDNAATRAGGGVFVRGGRLTLIGTLVANNTAAERGGGLFVANGGTVYLSEETLLIGNRGKSGKGACAGGPCGQSYFIDAPLAAQASNGTTTQSPPEAVQERPRVFYVLPTPPGYFLTPTVDCRRAALESSPASALALCPAEYRGHAPLEDAVATELTQRAWDSELPMGCSAGLVGFAGVVDDQRGSDCSGPCPAGHFCPGKTHRPTPCGPGTHCMLGSAAAQPCPGGTFSPIWRLRSPSGCHPVASGYYAPAGSAAALECPVAGYRCPGGRSEGSDGVKPVPLSIGTMRSKSQVTTEVDELSIDLACWPNATGQGPAAPEGNLLAGTNWSHVVVSILAGALAAPPDLMSSTEAAPAPADADARPIVLTVRILIVPPAIELGPVESKLGALTRDDLRSTLLDDNAMLGRLLSRVEPMDAITMRRANHTTTIEIEVPCPMGHYCKDGQVVPCAEGHYSNKTGQSDRSTCEACPPFSTSSAGSTSIFDCICIMGYYDARTNFSARPAECRLCVAATHCTERNTTVGTIPLRIGYYRISTQTLDIHACPDSTVGCAVTADGTTGLCLDGTSGCRGGVFNASSPRDYRDAQCASGLKGPFCRECDVPADGSRVFYEKASREQPAHCEPCELGRLFSVESVVIGGLLVLAAVALVALSRRLKRRTSQRTKDKAARWVVVLGLAAKLKMLYGCYTILSKLEPVYKVHLPRQVSQVLRLFAVLTSFGLDVAFGAPLQCFGWGGYERSLRFWMILPLVVIGLIGAYLAATAAHARARQRRRRAQEAAQLAASQAAAAQAAASQAAAEAWMAAPEGLRVGYESLLESQSAAGDRLELEVAGGAITPIH